MNRSLHLIYFFSLIITQFLICSSAIAQEVSDSNDETDLQKIIREAQPYGTISFNPNKEYVIKETLIINKPITIDGLTGKLPDSAGIIIIAVRSENVTLRNLKLTGNASTVSQEGRKPLIHVSSGNFIIENCELYDSSKDGIEVSNLSEAPIVGGVIKNIVGYGNMRDLISINGENDGHINHLLVENIRAYDSELRGGVEVSDGTKNTTVRKVYAENCIYAVDVQDHGYEGAINNTVMIEGIIAVNCRHAIRTANSDVGHSRHVFKNITADGCTEPLQISNIDGVYLENVMIEGHSGEKPPIQINNCRNVSVSDVILNDSEYKGIGFLVLNSDNVFIDHYQSLNSANIHGISYEITDGKTYQSLIITNSVIQGTKGSGIYLKASSGSLLKHLLVENNIAEVDNQLKMVE